MNTASKRYSPMIWPPDSADTHDTANLESALHILAGCYAANATMSYKDFAAKLSAHTQIAWWSEPKHLYALMDEINRNCRGCALTTCIVLESQAAELAKEIEELTGGVATGIG